ERRRRAWPMAIPVAMVAAAAITGAVWLRGGAEAGSTSVVSGAAEVDSVGTPLAPATGPTMPSPSNASRDGTAPDARSTSRRDRAISVHDPRNAVHGSKRNAQRPNGSVGARKPVAKASPEPAAWDPDSPTFPASK